MALYYIGWYLKGMEHHPSRLSANSNVKTSEAMFDAESSCVKSRAERGGGWVKLYSHQVVVLPNQFYAGFNLVVAFREISRGHQSLFTAIRSEDPILWKS